MDYKYQVCPILLKLCKQSANLHFIPFYFGAKFRRVDRGNAWSQDFLKLAFR